MAAILISCIASGATAAAANPAAIGAFADHCFSPFLTAGTAAERLSVPGARVDFYDLDPFTSAAPSPVTGRVATPGTDRRCEVTFDGDSAKQASEAVDAALVREGITAPAPLPATHPKTPGLAMHAARYLNPNRIAVVSVGTRPGPRGVETYMTVERLTPLN